MLNIALDEVRSLLDSSELAGVETEIASTLGLCLLPAGSAIPYKRILDLAEVAPGVAREALVREHDALVRFAVLVIQGSADDLDGEFPAGEEPAAEERERHLGTVGLENGTGLLHLCHYLLVERGRDQVLRYLELQRVPARAKFARELRGCYERAGGRTRG